MKVLLVRPPFNGMSSYIPPHLGLAMLSGYIKSIFKDNVEIILLDALPLKKNISDIIYESISINPDVIFITNKTFQINNTYKIIQEIKKVISPIIILGGNHITVDPISPLEKGVDFCIIGEGEASAVEILDAIFYRQKEDYTYIKGITFKNKNGKIIKTESREIFKEIDSFGIPDWSIFDLDKYTENIHIDRINNALPIMASRGCPYSCNFCSTYLTWGNTVRYRTVGSIINEIKHNILNYNILNYHFYDDNLLFNRQWIEEFSKKIIEEQIHISWICLSRPEFILHNKDLLPLLKKAGCKGFELGFEAGDNVLYKNMNKQFEFSDFEKTYNILKKTNFGMIEFLLMNFYDGETLFTLYQSNKLVNSLNGRNFYYLTSRYHSTPFPGTAFYDIYQQKGVLIAPSFDYFYAAYLTFMPHTFLDSSTKGFYLEVNKIKRGYLFIWKEYKLINKEIITLIIETIIGFDNLILIINNQMKKGVSIRELCEYIQNIVLKKINTDFSIKSIYELVGKIYILSLDSKALVYEN